ncbi:PDZ domain-containing protein [Mastigocoleus testarum]|uniref:PDZ domain-containing protein n=1 Tax=Mastigocoleus testarum BC008 TaxID=371196 RepID=A0A0V7ZKD6_9CYAN|nr:PDZ domain-containing protein [Mastigocoleus testarum]KST64913.1 hypothetical protein BC008_19075 [Mastigocoleus testarum BC008]KST67006.1 hypothetical protein BC008_27835 [Mastigocoleus testarum BC008]
MSNQPNAEQILQNIFQNVKVGGDLTTGDITQIGSLFVVTPDNPKKIEFAKKLVAIEVLSNISNLDARIGFVEESLTEDTFQGQLAIVRNKIAPALEQTASSSYNRLILQQTVASLRQALNSRPLKIESATPLVNIFTESALNAELVRYFYNHLIDVQDVTESLLRVVSDAASSNFDNETMLNYYKHRISLEINRLKNRSEITHLSGLRVLNSLDINLSDVNIELGTLIYLQPHQLVNDIEIETFLEKSIRKAEQLLSERQSLLTEGKELLSKALQEYEDINKLLEIKATDTWSEVVGKAISLRQLGRTTEAVAAFYRYGEIFSATDPTAKRYSQTAQQFTTQHQNFGVQGGVYIYEMVDGGKAMLAGIAVGDIVIDYAGRSIKGMDDLVCALRDALTGELVRITYLRMQDDGNFIRKTQTIVHGVLGVGFVPI